MPLLICLYFYKSMLLRTGGKKVGLVLSLESIAKLFRGRGVLVSFHEPLWLPC